MSALQNFAFEEHLVRIVEYKGEPWFVGTDVCKCLEIRNSPDAIGRLDEDEKTPDVGITDTSGTKYVTIISEPGVYRLVFRSRKPEAERFKRWLAHDVLPALRKHGHYGANNAPFSPQPVGETCLADAPLGAKVSLLQLIARSRGKEAAMDYMVHLGLPTLPPSMADEAKGGGASVLALLLAATYQGSLVKDWLVQGLDGDADACQAMARYGLRVSQSGDGFWIGNSCLAIKRLFADFGDWRGSMMALAGAARGERMSIGGVQTRTIWMPGSIID